jgi:hypothetical protein
LRERDTTHPTRAEPIESLAVGDLRADLIAITTHLAELLATEPMGSVVASIILEARRDSELEELRERFLAGRRSALAAVICEGMLASRRAIVAAPCWRSMRRPLRSSAWGPRSTCSAHGYWQPNCGQSPDRRRTRGNAMATVGSVVRVRRRPQQRGGQPR